MRKLCLSLSTIRKGRDLRCEMETIEPYRRRSPVKFLSSPSKKEIRDGWEVVLEYKDQRNGPFLIDLSHVPKWEVQDSKLSKIEPWGEMIPELPGSCTVQNGNLVSRMNPTQAAIWHLLEAPAAIPQEPAYTDVSDAYALMAVLGKEVFSLMEKVTALDLSPPDMITPFLLQGPVLHVPCQVVVLGHETTASAVLIACARGYGQSMCEALLDAGMEWGLRPAGETAFRNWLEDG